MDEISSTEFRKRYADLKQPTIVRSGKHVIGEWRPFTLAYPHQPGTVEVLSFKDADAARTVDRRAAQAQRDAILNRVNRGRKP